jgi:hypothetical protein
MRLTSILRRVSFLPSLMTVHQAETILLQTGVKIALQHRFAFDTGTVLRLENYAMINIFDDGRYYIQGENTEALMVAFSQIEQPWDPTDWSGEVPRGVMPVMYPSPDPPKRFTP